MTCVLLVLVVPDGILSLHSVVFVLPSWHWLLVGF